MFKRFVDAALSSAGEKMDAINSSAADSLNSVKNSSLELINEYWPKIESVLTNGLLQIAEDHLRDDKILMEAFDEVHKSLPMIIRISLKKETFIAFCMSNKQTFLTKLEVYKANAVNPHQEAVVPIMLNAPLGDGQKILGEEK